MLLQNRDMRISIPHTSTCVIRTKGTIHDGDTIELVSPVFSSVNYQSGSIELSETFHLPIRILTESRMIENPDGNCQATLVCDDDDVFNMYVRIQS